MNLFVDAALKSFVILALAGGVCLCWRRASAAMRHLIWFLAVVTLLCLPLFSFVLPAWHRPLWSVSAKLNPANEYSLLLEFAPRSAAALPAPEPQPLVSPEGSHARDEAGAAIRFDARWLSMAFTVWVAGVLLWGASIFASRWQLRKLRANARQVEEPLIPGISKQLGVRRRVILLLSNEKIMPMTWGWWRPVVLLPAEAEQWPAERRQLVLLHEFAHVARWDCLTQSIARMACALYWFNPLVWLAAHQMRIERERACDDLVLDGGCPGPDYADHLVQIARLFRPVRQVAAIAVARSSGLERRVSAILDRRRNRKRVSRLAAAILAISFVVVACTNTRKAASPAAWSLERSPVAKELRNFVVEKEAQAKAGTKREGKEMLPEYKAIFAAGAKGNWPAISNLFENLRIRAPQYEGHGPKDDRLHGTAWETVKELWGAFGNLAVGEEKYMAGLTKDAIKTVSPKSIYFGGTDPGRFLITALCNSHVKADPFFTVTQNALADGTYLEYLRHMYGARIHIPTEEDSSKAFADYMADVQRRHKENRLKPGEDFKMVDGRVSVTGQVAVMAINALLARIIFDRNPDREFYIEESFPLDWMYPCLSPAGPIMKINRHALSEISDAAVRADREYWSRIIDSIIGWSLEYDTPVARIAAHVEGSSPKAPPADRYLHGDSGQKWAAKLRSSIGALYYWRLEKAANDAEKTRMSREADFAFRQAYAVCPHSPEALFRYVNLLVQQNRLDDALFIANASLKIDPANQQFENALKELKRLKSSPK